MKKITFTNEVNGLSAAFSTDTPLMFPESFDGCSCGSEAITYRPLEYNGQRRYNRQRSKFSSRFGS